MLKMANDMTELAGLSHLLVKYGGGEIARAIGLESNSPDEQASVDDAASLAADLESLGPAYIKLAQIASTRSDVVPRHFVEAFKRLQDDVSPMSAETVTDVIREELGADPEQLFELFDRQPLACASLGQVHLATLRDGQEVVVKIQRTGVDVEARRQLESLSRISKVVDQKTDFGRRMRFESLVKAVDYAMSLELDYRREADNLNRLAENLSAFSALTVPEPVEKFVSRRVVVMQRIDGTSLERTSQAVLKPVDTDSIATQLAESYLKQLLIDGLFHADPHPGNLLLTQDRRIAVIDGGMVISVSPRLRRKLGTMLLAIAEGEGAEAARVASELGHAEDDFDMDRFQPAAARVIARAAGSRSDGDSIGNVIIELMGIAGDNGLVLPFELILFSKAILQLETTLATLSPKLNVHDTLSEFAYKLLVDEAGDYASFGRLARAALQSADLAANLPQRVNRITELVSANALRLKVDAFDEEKLVASVRKIANRITAGLVTSALIVGASLLMRVDEGIRILGYPLLSTLFFLVAAMMGLYLVWLALIRDE